ncbi:hypothetical protein JCM6882_008548 [Rhodosporidiobolus microsporus]
MTRFYYDDLSAEVAYSTSWVVYENSTNPDTSQWYDNSFHSCGADISTRRGVGCNATFTFQGPGSAYVIGDHNAAQRLFYCILDDGESSLPWKVYNASERSSVTSNNVWGLNYTRCAVSGLESKQYKLTFGQWQEDVNSNGVTMDYIVVDNATEPSTTVTWSSDFVSAAPQEQYSWTTATQSALPGSTTTSSSPPTSSATGDSSGGGSNSTAIGVGVGVGVGGAIGLALVGAWLLWRRRNRSRSEGSVATEPHHEIKGQSAASPAEYGRQSQFGGTVPEVQEYGTASNGVTPYSRPGGGLDNPATFRERGGAY